MTNQKTLYNESNSHLSVGKKKFCQKETIYTDPANIIVVEIIETKYQYDVQMFACFSVVERCVEFSFTGKILKNLVYASGFLEGFQKVGFFVPHPFANSFFFEVATGIEIYSGYPLACHGNFFSIHKLPSLMAQGFIFNDIQ